MQHRSKAIVVKGDHLFTLSGNSMTLSLTCGVWSSADNAPWEHRRAIGRVEVRGDACRRDVSRMLSVKSRNIKEAWCVVHRVTSRLYFLPTICMYVMGCLVVFCVFVYVLIECDYGEFSILLSFYPLLVQSVFVVNFWIIEWLNENILQFLDLHEAEPVI